MEFISSVGQNELYIQTGVGEQIAMETVLKIVNSSSAEQSINDYQ